MQVGELFVSLGVKGTDKTVQAFTQVKSSLGTIAESSLATKAAILGVFYGIEQLTAASAGLGTSLLNFQALTGQATKGVEQWGNAAKVAGGSFDEVLQTFTKVQDMMFKITSGQAAPRITAFLEKFTGFDRSKAGDTAYVMQHLRDFAQVGAQAGLPAALRNQLLGEVGFGQNMIALSQRGIFNNADRQPFTSSQQQRSLDNVNRGFRQIGLNWETLFKNLTSEHGGGIQGLERLSNALIHLIQAADSLGQNSGLFLLLQQLTALTSSGTEDLAKGVGGKASRTKSFIDGMEGNLSWEKSLREKFMSFIFTPDFLNQMKQIDAGSKSPVFNQTNHFHGPTTPEQIEKANKPLMRQLKQKTGATNARTQVK